MTAATAETASAAPVPAVETEVGVDVGIAEEPASAESSTDAPLDVDEATEGSADPSSGPESVAVETPTATPSEVLSVPTLSSRATAVELPGVELGTGDGAVSPLVVGVPDGASAPYAYWKVVDTDGNLVPGATFSFQRRNNNNDSWSTANQRSVADCQTSGCTIVDRDGDGGEFLVKWIGSDTPGSNPTGTGSTNVIQAGARYQIQPVNPPAGYTWVSSTAWLDSNSLSWSGTGNNRTLDFGTFVVAKIQNTLVCSAGYVYGVTANGQMKQLTSGGVTPIGSPASGVSIFNGLGVGAGGSVVYALERSSGSGTTQNGTVWTYSVSTGQWSSTGASTSALGENTGTNLIGGAVDLSTGLYYFGGFTSGGNFKIYQYDPSATPRIALKGTIITDATSSANGDIAFDAAGNLFIVRGSGTTTTIFSVTAANLAAATGGNITSSQSASVTTQSDVNGVAFDASGKGYLGAADIVRSYSMPGWTNASVFVDVSTLDSTDLASCSSPPTITIEKEVIGGRNAASDQFALTLRQGSSNGTVLGTATTTGTSAGIQNERIGPLPTVRGVALYFAETASGTTSLSQYASAYQCTLTYIDGSTEALNQVNGTSGSITIPANGEAVDCVFRNSPLRAGVTIHKDVIDVAGNDPAPRQNWGVTAQVSGGATVNPSSPTLQTDVNGDASWQIVFGSAAGRAVVGVSESMPAGYGFVSGQCLITHINGSTTSVELTGAATQNLSDIAPGDQVSCTYVNKELPGSVIWNKVDGTSNELLTGSAWRITGPGFEPVPGTLVTDWAGDPAYDGLDVDPVAGQFRLEGLQWGVYTVTESTVPVGYTGGSSFTFTVNGANAGTPIDEGNKTNARILGSVTVTKTDATSQGTLAGAVFQLWSDADGDGALDEETDTAVGAPVATPGNGVAAWNNLAWGKYLVQEVTAPVGYALADPAVQSFEVTSTNLALTATFANPRILGSVSWTKVDGSSPTVGLAGSEWLLSGPDGFEDLEITESLCTGAPTPATGDPYCTYTATGQFSVANLPWGEFQLVETRAPAGYVLDSDPHEFTISGTALTVTLDPIVNEHRDAPTLPLTGGLGRDFFTLLGGGLLIAAAAMLLILRRRRVEG